MKKPILLCLLVLTGMQLIAQSWTPTHLTSVIYLANTGLESHNNQLYATVFNGFTANLFRLNSNGDAWDTVSTAGITVPRSVRSAGSRLYLSSLNQGVYSMLYYSTDDGNSFNLDTAGLPKYFSGVATISSIQYYNGKVIVNAGSYGYYLKDTGAALWKHVDVPTALNGGIDPVTGLNDTLFAYDNTGTHALYVSGDYGATWTLRANNLGTDYGTNILVGDETTGRLYSAGGKGSSLTEYGLYYSDDHGITWTKQDLSAFIHKNAGNTQQLITALYASGPDIFLALENNKNSTAPDVISTNSGIGGFAYDTLGLPLNAADAMKGLYIVKHGGKTAIGFNTTDVFIKGGAVGMSESSMLAEKMIFYPNPVSDHIHIEGNEAAFSLVITDVLGRPVGAATGDTDKIDATLWSGGIYFVSIFARGQLLATKKIIRQ